MKTSPRDKWAADFTPLVGHELAWEEFLKAIERYAPVVLEELHNRGLPEFRRVLKSLKIAPSKLTKPWMDDFGEPRFPSLRHDLSTCIDPWAISHRLWPPTEPISSGTKPIGLRGLQSFFEWLSRVVICTLTHWSVCPSKKPPHRWYLDGEETRHRFRNWVAGPPSIDISGWAPARETKSDFKRRALEEVERQLACYMDSVAEDITQPTPWVPIESNGRVAEFIRIMLNNHRDDEPAKLQAIPYPKFKPAHFEWLVQFQVSEMNWPDIAQKANPKVTWENVKKGVHSAAEMMFGSNYKSWLRRGMRGRPRKHRK